MASILIVEDHPTMRDAMRLVLEEDGHQVEEASDGEAGIAMVRERRARRRAAGPEHPGRVGGRGARDAEGRPGDIGRARGRRHRDGGGGSAKGASRRAPTATSRSRSARSPCSAQWSGYFEVPGRRYRDGERGSFARLRFQGDPASHRLRQLPRDVEAEPGALRVGRRRLRLMEAVEDRLALVGRHARVRGLAPRTSPCPRSANPPGARPSRPTGRT